METSRNYHIARFSEIDPVPCPCGWSQRAFTEIPGAPASVHAVQIAEDAKTHYHKRMTEIYVVLEGSGHMELDGALIPVEPITTFRFRRGGGNRRAGKFKILNIAIPAFDPADEWFD